MSTELIQRALTAPTYASARRRVLRQLLESLLFEDALRVRTIDAGATVIDGIDATGGAVQYVAEARRRHGFGRVAVDPDTLRRVCGNADSETESVSQFLGEVRGMLRAQPEQLERFAQELEETLVKDALAQFVREERGDTLAGTDYDALEAMIMDGHRYHPTYKSRLGFDLVDNIAYGPEFAEPVRPVWLAARRTLAQVTTSRSLLERDFLRGQLGAAKHDAFEATIRARGEDPGRFTMLPVHPWQWRERISLGFAGQLAAGDLLVLGDDPYAFVAQQSIRTLACSDAPNRPYLKLALSIVNTSASRTLAPHTIGNAARISDWLVRVVGSDPFLRDELRTILLAEVMGTVVNAPQTGGLVRAETYGTLACIWRESLHPRLDPGERAVPFNGLTACERDGTPLINGWVRALGLVSWLSSVIDVSATPLLHLLCRHGIALESHAQNMVLLHRGGKPTRVALRDFHDGVRFCRARLAEPALGPELVTPAAHHQNPQSFRETDDLAMVANLLFGAFLFVNLGELAIFLEDVYELGERDFWSIVDERIMRYQRRFPELAARFELFDVYKPAIVVEKLALRRLLPDTELRLHSVPNPLASARDSRRSAPGTVRRPATDRSGPVRSRSTSFGDTPFPPRR
jgi:2-[(L-alanin-3-ylcarbamoyl)methyl]-3-(2-aminoethylcarbamoyl)-2-hydroxypropanoate synthase